MQTADASTAPAQQQRRYRASQKAQRTFNPIRAIVDNIQRPQSPSKPMIDLSLGEQARVHCT